MIFEELECLKKFIEEQCKADYDNILDELVKKNYINNGLVTKKGIKALEDYKVDNAIILSAGMSSRFSPLSYEIPKGLIKVKGEVLIERQIKQLKEAGINEIIIVVGYKKEMFYYLKDKFGVEIIENPDYNIRNNHSSLFYARDWLKNSYICSSDNYFTVNVFEKYIYDSFYSSVFANGETKEWCLFTDKNNLIYDVTIGGKDKWVMLGHAYFSKNFSEKFKEILIKSYKLEEVKSLLWEGLYLKNIKELQMYIKKYSDNDIFEFDTLDELRKFDEEYINDTNSKFIQEISEKLKCKQRDIICCEPVYLENRVIGFTFHLKSKKYAYDYKKKVLISEVE
ncbi:NTP transferase domain-containing protein [Clostridium botulinum]|uniref:NTP transferase domain-containing protein n=1 Tax=Clostridium botulinum TaxID=1491 RepID=UPI002491A50F|nr:NTP transferase domain-containing protein [Clostridium botulinum]BDB02550.1 choline-phosphate cytidylyltransferase [Clostridium botulinum]